MLDKIKKIAREVIAVVIVILLYRLKPDMVTWNYVILTSLTFTATIDGDKKITKFFSLPSLIFFGVTLSILFGLVTKPLTLEFVILLSYLAGIKSVKKLIEKLKETKLNKVQ